MKRAGGKAAAMLAQNGAEVEVVVVDVAAPATFETARKLIEDRFGRLDVLINNAGIGDQEDWQSTAENVPIDTLRRTFETNFFGLVDLTQRLLPLLRRSDIRASSINRASLAHSPSTAIRRASSPMSTRSATTRARRP
jgi:NAD(P)-dependent dehydrogenase (short-subunit alcohol dehydrogenase family)